MIAIITGAAGFTGAILSQQLRKHNIEVYAVVRPQSEHNARLDHNDPGLHLIELQGCEYNKIPDVISIGCDVFYHLMWSGGKGTEGQKENIDIALDAVKAAYSLGCKRIVLTGSQAEYGVVAPDRVEYEDNEANPFTPYGASKVAACHMTRALAKEMGIEWIWGRIFSLIGKYEPRGRMLPDLYYALKEGREMSLSSCRQNWDYLDVYDAADALIALAEKGHAGEIYNIANGNYRVIKEYTEELRNAIATNAVINYGDDPDPFISLQPSVEKIREHTGWKTKRSFLDSIYDYGT